MFFVFFSIKRLGEKSGQGLLDLKLLRIMGEVSLVRIFCRMNRPGRQNAYLSSYCYKLRARFGRAFCGMNRPSRKAWLWIANAYFFEFFFFVMNCGRDFAGKCSVG